MVIVRDTRDEGFSLTELMVVLALLGVILAVSYGGLQAVYASRDVSDRQALVAAEISSPLNAFEEVLSQTLTIEAATPYSITVLTDSNNDDSVERHQIQATTGGQVIQRRWATNASRQNTALKLEAVWSDHNTNVADSAPFIRYFDENGDETANIAAATTVRVALRIEHEGREFSDSRLIYMRNR